jgi:hypothetical protein
LESLFSCPDFCPNLFSYRLLIVFQVLALSTIILAFVALFLAYLVNPRTPARFAASGGPESTVMSFPCWSRWFGRENLDPRQSYVNVANHQANMTYFFSMVGWASISDGYEKGIAAYSFLGMAC